jgi:hypothetical protein
MVSTLPKWRRTVKRLISFDAYAGAYDVVDALYPVRAMAGVKSVEVLAAVEGSPKFCVIIDVDDAQDPAVVAKMEALGSEYAGYHSNMASRAYKQIG